MTSTDSRPRAALTFILITLFLDILGIGIIIPVLPELVKEFVGGSTTLAGRYVGVIGATYSLMQFLCAAVMGALSDRFGRRPIILASLFGLGVDFLIQGLAPSVGWLFLGTTAGRHDGRQLHDRERLHRGRIDSGYPSTQLRVGGRDVWAGVHLRTGAREDCWAEFTCDCRSSSRPDWHWRIGSSVSSILPESLPPEKRSSFTLAKANPFATMRRLRSLPDRRWTGRRVCLHVAGPSRFGKRVGAVHQLPIRLGRKQTNGLTLGLVGLMAAIVQGLLARPMIARLGERRAVMLGLAVSTLAFLGYGLAYHGWMILGIIVFGAFGGLTGPAIQSIVAGSVDSSDQGKIQGALTSLMSLTNIVAPLLFTAGLFSYFTSAGAVFQLPGAPFFLGSILMFIALLIVRKVFRRWPETAGRIKE